MEKIYRYEFERFQRDLKPKTRRKEKLNFGPLGFVVSLNVKRRNLTESQLAISAARAWKQAEGEGLTRPNGGDARALSENQKVLREAGKHFARMFGVSPDYTYMARRVLDYSAELAEQVAAGKSLDGAYGQATVVP